MTHQLSLFGADRPHPNLEPVDPDGAVIEGAPDVTLRLPHPSLAWDLAALQLHEHEDGRWMWAVTTASGGYKVGQKWGRFASTQAEAMRFAAAELLDWCDRKEPGIETMIITSHQLRAIRIWAEEFL